MKKNYKFVAKDKKTDIEESRKSLTYWQDVWRRLRKNKLAIAGLVGVGFIFIFAVIGPMLHNREPNTLHLDYKNVPPRLTVYSLDEDYDVFMSEMYHLMLVSEDGELLDRFELADDDKDLINRTYTYRLFDDEENELAVVVADFTYQTDPVKKLEGIDYSLTYKGTEIKEASYQTWNTSFYLGTDNNGRDLLARVMYGTGISLIIAFVAAIINLFIGVIYGSVAGYTGGNTDIVMMRIVDIINSIPLLLYVILLSVVLKDSWVEHNILDAIFGAGGLGTIILTLVTVYWVGMARLVRGQILGLKEQEYILAARTIGVPNRKIISKHLVPNALGPIIVSMTMMIPSAVFTEAFLSFIGIGVSAPQASWGTLANDALNGLRSFGYQLFFPSIAICITMLAFNFLGDGLRDALDPRLRK